MSAGVNRALHIQYIYNKKIVEIYSQKKYRRKHSQKGDFLIFFQLKKIQGMEYTVQCTMYT